MLAHGHLCRHGSCAGAGMRVAAVSPAESKVTLQKAEGF